MFKPDPLNAQLDAAIERVMTLMSDESPSTDTYEQMNNQLQKLYAIKNENRSRRVSPDTLANICANLLGIGVVVGYEQKHIITTKALGFIKKLF